MSKKHTDEELQQEQEQQEQPIELTREQELEAEVEELKQQVEELNDIKLRQMAEFDNFRRRTNKEKLDIMASAGEDIFKEMLPLVDDFERAVAAMSQTDDIDAVREGIKLIQQKFLGFLDKHEVHAIETEGVDFNTDEH